MAHHWKTARIRESKDEISRHRFNGSVLRLARLLLIGGTLRSLRGNVGLYVHLLHWSDSELPREFLVALRLGKCATF